MHAPQKPCHTQANDLVLAQGSQPPLWTLSFQDTVCSQVAARSHLFVAGQVSTAPFDKDINERCQAVWMAQPAPARVRVPDQQQRLGLDTHAEQAPEHCAPLVQGELHRFRRNTSALHRDTVSGGSWQ